MMAALLFLTVLAQSGPVIIRTAESPAPESFPALEVAEGEIGVVLGAPSGMAEILSAAGFSVAPFTRGKIAFISDPKTSAGAGVETVVWVAAIPREQAAAVLRETKGIALCIVSGRGSADPEPLKIGEAWMVQAPGTGGLWGRVEFHGTSCANRFSAPDGRPSVKAAALRTKAGIPPDPLSALRESARAVAVPETGRALQTANRACRLSILSISERTSYGARPAQAGKKLLVLDAEFENTIPMTLIQSHQVPSQYKIREMGDHLYLVVNGSRVSRLLPEGSQLPGHLVTSGFALDRLGARARGNLIFEIPAEGVETVDLRFYDFAHGHMALTLRERPRPPSMPLLPLQANEILEAGVFRVDRLGEFGGRKAPEGMTFFAVEMRARSMTFMESDASAFDPKAKPGEKLQVGTVSDWKDARKHLHMVLDGEFAYGPAEGTELGEAPRFLPDLQTGGRAVFLVPGKSASLEVRCDFPNARLPDGKVMHPKPLSFLLEGLRPVSSAKPAVAEIDDEVFKVAVTGQSTLPQFGGHQAPAGSVFLVLDVTIQGAGLAGEMFQTVDQIHYVTEKGAQLPMHEAAFRGPRAPGRLLLCPTGERRSFQAVFAIPVADRKPRLAYRGVSKAVTVELRPLDSAPAARACPKCKREAGADEKFCADCGTKIDK